MPPGALTQVLRQLPVDVDPDLLVGVDTSDDAGVYRISDDTALILSVDFFPPIVDDPFTFGQISAANALSDIYAMGGEPRLALNIVCFPKKLPIEVLNDIIRGAVDKLKEAGALLVGGHTIEDEEVKFGLSVTGFVNPERLIRNSSAAMGDQLILTKPLGTGVVASAVKAGRCGEAQTEALLSSMRALNKIAGGLMHSAGASACTDITGFGLLGHAFEMAKASGVTIKIDSGKVPLLLGAKKLASNKKNHPGNIKSNMEHLAGSVTYDPGMESELLTLLHDPQTSGGLLISIGADKCEELTMKLNDATVDARIVGEVLEARDEEVVIVE